MVVCCSNDPGWELFPPNLSANRSRFICLQVKSSL